MTCLVRNHCCTAGGLFAAGLKIAFPDSYKLSKTLSLSTTSLKWINLVALLIVRLLLLGRITFLYTSNKVTRLMLVNFNPLSTLGDAKRLKSLEERGGSYEWPEWITSSVQILRLGG